MSGGHFSYLEGSLQNEMFGWTNTWRNVMEDREISELVWDVLNLIHDYDWYRSGDTEEAAYLKAKDAFKRKWLGGNRGVRVKRIVDNAIADARAELYKTFGIMEDDNDTK